MMLAIDRWRGKVAIVTGASSGIGAAITEKLVEEGLQVVGLDIQAERAEKLAEKLQGQRGKFHVFKTDITKEEDILKAFKWASDNLGPIYILINNAGILQKGNLTDGDTEKWRKVLDTNVLGLCIATREAVKIMKANKIDGHIVHINSIAGHAVQNVRELNLYAASKHAATALTETLRQELNHLGLKIKITSISPGMVNTEIFKTGGFIVDAENYPILKPEDIADSVWYVLSTPPHVQVHELTIKPVGESLE